MDDRLLARLDRDPEVKRLGRSAIFRRAAEVYLRDRGKAEIAAAYRKAYGNRRGAPADLDGWAEEGAWPER